MAKPNKMIALDRRLAQQESIRQGMDFAPYVPRLWEVTAVDTEAGTCTIQQAYKNLAGTWALVANSEREVLYDPDNEPSVGDRGALVRTATGASCFFSRASAGTLTAATGAATLNLIGASVSSRVGCMAQTKYITSGAAITTGTQTYCGLVQFGDGAGIADGMGMVFKNAVLAIWQDAGGTTFFGLNGAVAVSFRAILDPFDVGTDSFATLNALTLSPGAYSFVHAYNFNHVATTTPQWGRAYGSYPVSLGQDIIYGARFAVSPSGSNLSVFSSPYGSGKYGHAAWGTLSQTVLPPTDVAYYRVFLSG